MAVAAGIGRSSSSSDGSSRGRRNRRILGRGGMRIIDRGALLVIAFAWLRAGCRSIGAARP